MSFVQQRVGDPTLRRFDAMGEPAKQELAGRLDGAGRARLPGLKFYTGQLPKAGHLLLAGASKLGSLQQGTFSPALTGGAFLSLLRVPSDCLDEFATVASRKVAVTRAVPLAGFPPTRKPCPALPHWGGPFFGWRWALLFPGAQN
jgi:hypothetical protein